MEPPKGRKKRGIDSLAFFDANLCAWSPIGKLLLIHELQLISVLMLIRVLTPSQKVN